MTIQGGQQGGQGYGAPPEMGPPPGPQYPMQAQQPQPTGGVAVQRGPCQACARHAPLKQVTFMQNVGLLIMRFPRTVKGYLCKRCISQYFWKMTAITFFFGWWGIISFFYSLVSIPVNIANFLGARGLPDE